ncbi:MAG: 30S ribosomal protein S18 [Candidatus Acidiferrales bacterium]
MTDDPSTEQGAEKPSDAPAGDSAPRPAERPAGPTGGSGGGRSGGSHSGGSHGGSHSGSRGGPRREGGGPSGGGPGGGGPGGGGPRRGKRQYFRKKKVCRFCVERVDFIDYKKAEMLQPFVQERGKILPRRITGTCSRHQRWLGEAIKRARNIALLPFATEL